ncbi:hypothetical protein [Nitratireductor basaltis]|uniref:1,4-alpha-glucan branching enzyme n=1 Tax=Nitratireductor basaltis TaxID=472175 RepID=A0A084UAU2_9HYPH|nr:hypothetical protein [Nitratireductor basaltis]KFB10078.1 hypothetical protein EL18_01107 [Nitratireductor basaltis]
MSEAKTTTDHETIRRWAEARDGHPARVRDSAPGGVLRIDFGEPEENLEKISWEEFFQIFDSNNLAFLYQDETSDGGTSRFNKFINKADQ